MGWYNRPNPWQMRVLSQRQSANRAQVTGTLRKCVSPNPARHEYRYNMTTTRVTNLLSGLCRDDSGRCLRLAAAFAAVYIIWGSTYLAIRVAIETIPPFVMAGSRFFLAGAILYVWSATRGSGRPSRAHWLTAVIVGGLLLAGGNGAVTWSEQEVPSGLAALVVATIPIWMVLLDALRPGGTRPTRFTILGVAIGFLGIALLFGPANLSATEGIRPISMIVLFFAPLSWAIGSLYSRGAPKPQAPLQGIGMQMLCGGASAADRGNGDRSVG